MTDDLISRQAALDALENCEPGEEEFMVKSLPSAQPERKSGRWIWEGFNIVCSECDAMPMFDSTEPLYRFCPNCGAEMKGDNDD